MLRHDPGHAFRALHQRGNPFILANAWDIGSAKLLAALGAQALATTSAGHAFTLGLPDMGNVTRESALAHAADLVAATPLPVSGDLENGYGEAPGTVAETIRLACEAGLAGCSIEDTALPSAKPYDFDLAVERVRAAVAASRALARDFVLVARADGIMNGNYGIDEALRRLKAFEAAGADCLYAPLPKTTHDQRRICTEIKAPVNVLAVGPVFARLTRQDYAEMGAARISVGSALARLTHAAILRGARAMLDDGDFSELTKGASGAEIDAMLQQF